MVHAAINLVLIVLFLNVCTLEAKLPENLESIWWGQTFDFSKIQPEDLYNTEDAIAVPMEFNPEEPYLWRSKFERRYGNRGEDLIKMLGDGTYNSD